MKLINYLDHTFMADGLGKDSTVLDLGGNNGLFTEMVNKKFGSKVLVFEPVPELFEKIKAEHPSKKYKEAVMPVSGETIEIHLSDNGCPTALGKSNKTVKAKTISLDEIFKRDKLESVALLKMDIEGPEVPILEDVQLELIRKIDQITIEFHDFIWPELKPRVEAIKNKMKTLGYYCIPFSITNNGDVLFVKKEKISFLNYIWLKFVVRYFKGIKRKINKLAK